MHFKVSLNKKKSTKKRLSSVCYIVLHMIYWFFELFFFGFKWTVLSDSQKTRKIKRVRYSLNF